MILDKISGTKDILILTTKIREASTIAISGHLKPDGDCVGACLGLCTYLRENYPDKTVDVILDPVNARFHFLKYADEIIHQEEAIAAGIPEMSYDIYFCLDCSETERLGFAEEYFFNADFKVCIDHHITNKGFGNLSFIQPGASSTCEIIYTLLDKDKISLDCANALYTGIVHDTGVFAHNNTTRRTMEITGALIEKGIDTEKIIDDTFFRKTYIQNQILGRALMESILVMDGQVIFSVITKKDMHLYGIDSTDLEGIVDQLRVTQGVEVALLLYEQEDQVYKVSMRSNGLVNVSKIAVYFGGGGHAMAAGCTMSGKARDVINSITALVEDQIQQKEING
jgi:phosphoesterase RecJ-like protein